MNRVFGAVVAAALTARVALGASPGVIIDEDFTTGAFRDNSAAHWRVNTSEGVGFKAPNDRDFPVALARTLSEGAYAWGGATWAIWDDHNGNGEFNDGEMQKFSMNKADDICVLRFRAFSDVAGSSPWIYGVEVAMMEWWDAYAGSPNWYHDLQWEGRQVWHTEQARGPLQLIPNIENEGENADDYPSGTYPEGVKYTHWETNGGFPTQEILDRTWDNMVVWRPMPEERKINFEIWGEANYSDHVIDTPMNSTHDPDNPDAVFDHIQITLFRNYMADRTTMIRDGVSAAEAQVGILDVHVGLSKKADFTLDYLIDESDAAVLTANWGRTDTTTIRTGDATNDQRIDLDDANPLIGFWSDPVQGEVSASGTYDPQTGSITLSLDNVSFFTVVGEEGTLTGDPPLFSGLSATRTSAGTGHIGAFTTGVWRNEEVALGPVAATGLAASDLTLVVNYRGSGLSEGVSTPLDGTPVRVRPDRRDAGREGPAMALPSGLDAVQVRVHDLRGRLLMHRTIPAASLAPHELARTARTPGIVSVSDARTGRLLHRGKTAGVR